MLKQTYALPPDGCRQLEVSWRRDCKLLVIRLDGKSIGMISNIQAVRGQQKIFRLQDGSTLKVEKSRSGNGINMS